MKKFVVKKPEIHIVRTKRHDPAESIKKIDPIKIKEMEMKFEDLKKKCRERYLIATGHKNIFGEKISQ